jgi:hypothetical protein
MPKPITTLLSLGFYDWFKDGQMIWKDPIRNHGALGAARVKVSWT